MNREYAVNRAFLRRANAKLSTQHFRVSGNGAAVADLIHSSTIFIQDEFYAIIILLIKGSSSKENRTRGGA